MTDVGVDVVIFCATGNEAAAVRRVQAKPFRQVTCGGGRASLGSLGDLRCLTVEAGLGERRLARCFRAAAEKFRPRVVINFGAAGGIRPELEIGARTVPREILSYSCPDLKVSGDVIRPSVDSFQDLQEEIVLTRAGACRRFVHDDGARSRVFAELEIDTTDWETYRVASLCREHDIPFVALRCVTDHAGSVADLEYGAHSDRVLASGARLLGPLAERALGALPVPDR
jgi:adenosylhomocysteine nucleosidase